MSITGDLHNNLEKLKLELRNTNVPAELVDLEAISTGNPVGFLPLLHCILLDNWLYVARFLSQRGYQLYPTHDRQFVEGVFKVVRNEFSYLPSLTLDQFLGKGFAERKIIFLCDVIKLCKRKAEELERSEKDPKRVIVPSNNGNINSSTSNTPTSTTSSSAASFKRSTQVSASPVIARSPLSRKPFVSEGNGVTNGGSTGNGRFHLHHHHPLLSPQQHKKNNHNNNSNNNNNSSSSKRRPHTGSSTEDGENGGVIKIKTSNNSGGGSNGIRHKANLSLQTNGHLFLNQEEVLRSPTSSGPVSPVSITSAASAPAVFRQQPIKAKPEMIGHVPTNQYHYYHPHHDSTEFQNITTNFTNANRAMECWVTSPPQLLEGTKKKEALAHHLGKNHPSIRLRTTGSNSVSNSRPSTSSSSTAASHHHQQKRKQHINNTTTTNKTNEEKWYTDMRSSISVPQQQQQQQQQRSSVHNRGKNNGSTMGGASKSFSPEFKTPNITRKLSLSSNTTAGPSNASSVGGDDHSSNAGSDTANLADQVSKLVVALDSLSDIPNRMAMMEKKMMKALETMDKRISTLDDKLKGKQENGNNKKHQQQRLNGKGSNSSSSNKKHTNKESTNNSNVVEDDNNNIQDFIKVIEERFRETETVLAESQN